MAFTKINDGGTGVLISADVCISLQRIISEMKFAMEIAQAVKAVTQEIPQIANLMSRKNKAKIYSEQHKNNKWGSSINKKLQVLFVLFHYLFVVLRT